MRSNTEYGNKIGRIFSLARPDIPNLIDIKYVVNSLSGISKTRE